MLTHLCVALALASAPKVAVVVVDGAEALRDELERALLADPSVTAQPRSLVDEVLAASAAAGLVCTIDDLPCWTKIGLDGELDELVVAGSSASGDLELVLVDIGRGREVRRISVAAGPAFDAPAALARLLHPEPSATEAAPTTGRTSAGPAPLQPATREPPQAAPPAASSTMPVLLIAAGGAGLVAATCGVAAGVLDVGLTEMLVDAKETGARLDIEAFHSQENTQSFLIGCGAIAGVVAVASAAGAWIVE